MPMHDWTRVDRSIFHSFNLGWTAELSHELNGGLLPSAYYALCETVENGRAPGFAELRAPTNDFHDPRQPGRSLSRHDSPPQTRLHLKSQVEYAEKVVTIRHCEDHDVVAAIRIVTADNKRGRNRCASFVEWAIEVIRSGKSLLIVDPFPPGPHDPHGVHQAIWGEFQDRDFDFPAGKPLAAAVYTGFPLPEIFIEPIALGAILPEMPLFLDPDIYVNVPLEATYQAAYRGVPECWRPE